jgi:GWxTD domain-containing protein
VVQSNAFLDEGQPYIELVFFVDGKSVYYVLNRDGKYEAEVEVKATIRMKDSTIARLHYIIGSNLYADTLLDNKKDFYDIQNIRVPQGDYTIYYELRDKHGSGRIATSMERFSVQFPDDRISTSNIGLLSSISQDDKGLYHKYGIALTPIFQQYVGEYQSQLPFYVEIYNSHKIVGEGKHFTVRSYLENVTDTTAKEPPITVSQEYATAPVVLYIQQFNIANLPSGNYNVVVDILNEDSLLLTHKAFFFRSNPTMSFREIKNTFASKITDSVELFHNVFSLFPIATPIEQDFIERRIKKMTVNELQQYLYAFWVQRNPYFPEKAWMAYKARVDYAQSQYGSRIVRGYKTDRGRIYLKYGPPSSIKDHPFEPNTYPYQIWEYYTIDDERNVKFVFWSPASVTNEYELLHSTKRGEYHDQMWQRRLTQKMDPQEDFDDTKAKDVWGGRIDDEWRIEY